MKALWLLLSLAVALVAAITLESVWGGGHPSLGALLLYWTLYPTLTLYLSRELFGSEFLSPLLTIVGLLEYVVLGLGLAALITTSQSRVMTAARVAIVVLVVYVGAQGAAHLLLSLPFVNLRLLAHTNPAVSLAAVIRIRDAGDLALVPALQQKLVDDFTRDDRLDADLLDALTALGGAKGWQDLLESGRLGVAGPAARAWRAIANNVDAMTNPLFSDARGGVRSSDLGEEDITRFVEALAVALVERLRNAPDSEASLTLLSLMRERPALCRRYFAFVPIGLRDAAPQAAIDLVRGLALLKAGPPADLKYDYQAAISKDEMSRFVQARDAVAEEWVAWAKSNAPCR